MGSEVESGLRHFDLIARVLLAQFSQPPTRAVNGALKPNISFPFHFPYIMYPCRLYKATS